MRMYVTLFMFLVFIAGWDCDILNVFMFNLAWLMMWYKDIREEHFFSFSLFQNASIIFD